MKRFALCLVLLMAVGAAWAQGEIPAQREARMAWWTQARFGLFIHWGPVSLKGTEISWSRLDPDRPGGYNRMWVRPDKGEVPTAEYDNLYKKFNPTRFNAREWVAIAKAAGMKYMVLTTKHHDGFCEFDSKLTDYKVTNSPLGRDVVKEYADACHEAGMKLGFYYSPADFYHPDFLTPNHANYIKYLHGQVRELLTNYGKVDVLWFDGLLGTAKEYDSENLFKMIRQLQPQIIINNRCGLPADFDTPEQRIGAFQNTRPWESCITICNQWAYKPNDKMKPLDECIRTLVSCACGDGNLLFNVGPLPTGEIEPRQVARLREMGAWMEAHGETIYGTRGGPFLLGKNGGSTHKGNTIYLHVFDWHEATLELPDPEKRIVSAKLHGGKGTVEMQRTAGGVTLGVTAAQRDAIDTVIALSLNGPADAIAPVRVGSSPSLTEAALDFQRLIPAKLPRRTFALAGFNVWGNDVVKGEDGKYHMFFERWPTSRGFDAWATHNEIAHAVADNLLGPYHFKDVALPRRGPGFWDGDAAYNPAILKAGGKYYLYYAGNRGSGYWDATPADRKPLTRDAEWWVNRNNQRVGVAIADSPDGPWKRFDKPLVDVTPGRRLTSTPTVMRRLDWKFQMVYKTVLEKPGRFGGAVQHIIALADSPLGPFKDCPHPFIRAPKSAFPIDDHVEWPQDGRYYCIAKDNGDNFTQYGKALLLFESPDGFEWGLSPHPLVHKFEVEWADGARQSFDRFEMPKVFLEDGKPAALFLAAKPTGREESFGVAIDLQSNLGQE